ncbi:catalase [Geodermatophilus sp. Leaf369]|jgi:catalase|uniref:catalase n=1 Tax=Geodermatophilus sp. Leaf369 TaxID=1736354 RepID=UPI0006F646F9|nr:catalase [Geodermatophilus sp. Leaf369]KQS60235.1 catalase [Geodermatophilus sp. Leaf369]
MPPVQQPDQSAPAQVSATGAPFVAADGDRDPRAQSGDVLTSPQGVRIPDTDHSLKAGRRGPILLEDFHLREKISHFDHERIPERAVHARGAGAHGVFTSYGTAGDLTRAGVLAEKDLETPVFVRFSTVLGSRGAADSVRDTRGFAVKFYTQEGNWDLVGNNMPVFFIQEAIKFPDLIHAAKPSPDREIPSAQSAHDSFWDFVSLHTEATHHTLWNMSDRGIPRSYRMMEGFGVHSFRLVNAAGETVLVQFKWTPKLGVHSLTWEEAQIAAGVDPDFHRRDLADAIEAGAFPEWELGVQVFEDNEEQTFQGIDLLDSTKIVPEELVPVQPIGRLVLNANPTNYFAETEQVAFNTAHVVPGIEFSNDPLLQGRNFSYQDTQLTRLGGPNWTQLPINRPQVSVNDNHRDGFMQQGIPTGRTGYHPNSIDGGSPAPAEQGGYTNVPRPVSGEVVRGVDASFDDHFSQPAMFYASLSDVEKTHTIEAYTFELGKVYEQSIKERVLGVLVNIDADLAAQVAEGLGLPVPEGATAEHLAPSPALAQVTGESFPADGRQVGVVAGPDADIAGIATLRAALEAAGAQVKVIAPRGGLIGTGASTEVVERTNVTARSIEFDAIVVAGGAPKDGDIKAVVLLQEAFRQLKPFAAWGDGVDVLTAAGIDTGSPGVLTGADASDVAADLLTTMGLHRVWERADLVTASAVPPAA